MYYCRVLFLSVVCAGSLLTQVRAADVPVSVGDNFFNPRNVTINVNDRVVWTWTGISSHTSTGSGSPPLWDSGYRTSGTFSRVFDTVGRFNYYCIPHFDYPSYMSGSVTVQGGNTPPTVTITSPANNAVLIATATFTVAANASDPGGSVR
jgi:plastocyanin